MTKPKVKEQRCFAYEVYKKDYDEHLDEICEQCDAFHWGLTWD